MVFSMGQGRGRTMRGSRKSAYSKSQGAMSYGTGWVVFSGSIRHTRQREMYLLGNKTTPSQVLKNWVECLGTSSRVCRIE